VSAAIRLLNSVSHHWVDAALSVVWQSTVLILAVALVLHFFRRLPPAIRCWAWRLVALKLLVMPFWAIGVPVLAPPTTRLAPSQADTTSDSVAMRSAVELSGELRTVDTADFLAPAATQSAVVEPKVAMIWQSVLLAAYICIVTLQVARLMWQRHQLGDMLRATELSPIDIANLVDQCSEKIDLRQPPEVRLTSAETSPFVCQIFRPFLVLPASLTATAAAQLRPIVLHELAHIRRRDLAWRMAMEITRILWWFHPLAHWVACRESLERELACDQLAMLHAKFSAADYARTLVDAASRMAFPSALRAAAAANFDGGQPLATPSAPISAHQFLRSVES